MAQTIDLDMWGNLDYNGQIKEYTNEDALKNALTLWLTSKRNDFLMDPEEGGVLDETYFKTLSDSTIEKLSFSIKNSIIKYFVPEIRLDFLDVIPDYKNKTVQIEIKYTNQQTGVSNSLTLYTKDKSEVKNITYENVAFIEENLYHFVMMKKNEMEGEKIIYNADEGKFYWGKYKLINFTHNDSYFNQILELANL